MPDLPVPLHFRLPGREWEPRDPGDLGVANAAFLAVRADVPGGYTPTISISGDHRDDGATLERIADEGLVALEREADGVRLEERRQIGGGHAPGVTQLVACTITVEGTELDLRQCQVVLDLHDVEDARRRVVVVLSLTCLLEQTPAMLPEFQALVRSVRIGEDPDGTGDGDGDGA